MRWGLVGYAEEGGVVRSSASGNAEAWTTAGGLVGGVHGMIEQSFDSGRVTARIAAGGLVGSGTNATSINDSYALGDVVGADDGDGENGGLVGAGNATVVTNCDAQGVVSGPAPRGALVGAEAEFIVTASYYLSPTGAADGTRHSAHRG